jgi:heme-degrading monooxygenase HmoA
VLTIVWEFRVRPGAVSDFESHYGPAGTWVSLFRRSKGYLGTALLRDDEDPTRYLTLDRWDDEASYLQFQHDHAAAYASLDAACAGLTTEERPLGHFTAAER